MADTPEPDEKRPTDPGERLDPERLKAEAGSAEAALRNLAYKLNDVEADNKKYRDRIRELELPEGAVVLSGDDLAAYEALTALGTADEVKAKLTQAEEDARFRAEREREAEFAKVAEAAGVSLAALQSAKGSDQVEYEIETTKNEEGEDTPVVYVKEGEGERVPFSDYVDTHWAPLKAALYATDEQAGKSGTPQVQRPAVRFVTQTPGGRPPAPKPPDAQRIAEQKRLSARYTPM